MKVNQIIVNPKKSQAMFISRKKNALPKDLKVQLPGVTIDNRLKFDQHISRLCKSAGFQLNSNFSVNI